MNKHPYETLLTLFYAGTSHKLRDYYPKLLFNAEAQACFMSIVGFIVATYKGGNIKLAMKMAEDINYVMKNLCNSDSVVAQIAPDISCMSFSFLLLGLVEDQSMDHYRQLQDAYNDGKGVFVTRAGRYDFDKKTYAKIYNGGIIFHYARELHKLDSHTGDTRLWSVHT